MHIEPLRRNPGKGGRLVSPGWKRHAEKLLSDESWSLVVFFGVPALAFLYAMHRIDPVYPHYLAQIFTVVIAAGVFLLTWSGRRFLDNHYFLLLGISLLYVGIIDGLHAIAFDGWLGEKGDYLDTQLWYASRFLLGGSLVIAPRFVHRKIRAGSALAAFFIAATVLAVAFSFGMPTEWFRHREHPWFMGANDLALFCLGVAGYVAHRRTRAHFDGDVHRNLALSILLVIASGVAEATGMRGRHAFFLVGDLLISVAYFLFYKALIETGLVRPYDLLFRNLKQSEEEAREARSGLESRVAERTAELLEVNELLGQELSARRTAEQERETTIDLLRLINRTGSLEELVTDVTSFLKGWSGCESVWIRYRPGAGYPHLTDHGFLDDAARTGISICPAWKEEGLVGKEPALSSPRCLSGVFVPREADPSLPEFPGEGFFWTNSVTSMVSGNDGSAWPEPLQRFCHEGFESLAILPLRSGKETIGFLQFGDRRAGFFTPEMISRCERIAEHVAVAFARHLSKEALRESEDRFRSLVENVPAGILIVQDGRVVFGNPGVDRLFGGLARPVRFRDIGGVLPEDQEKFDRLCGAVERAGTDRLDVDLRFLLPEGDSGQKAVRCLFCQAGPVEYRRGAATLVVMNDMTRMKDLEQIVSTREKLSIIGQMAAGIAHEIRNPLSGININVSTLEHVVRGLDGIAEEERKKIGEIVSQAKAASDKIATVIRRVMDFTKPAPPKLERVDVNQVAREALAFCSSTLRKNGIVLVETLFPGLPRCNADPRLLEQVLLNLITNAVEAMEAVESGKRLGVATEADGSALIVRVFDNGPGVPIHIRERIFDPFYTTRKTGHGIGLSFSRRVIENHGGTLTVAESEWGGAEFRILLPVDAERSSG
ncbi:MAG: hypothetical protein H6Q84_1331 [Deltaproteobacteria bacterium]|nr:hypothetical protein [Deltaproteobacteria bacterium]